MTSTTFTPEEFKAKAKQYLLVESADFVFKFSEFMSSLHTQYNKGKILSEKQQSAFMRFVVGHETRELMNDKTFLSLNFGADVRIQSIAGKVLSTKVVFIDSMYTRGTEASNEVTMETEDNLVISFVSGNAAFVNNSNQNMIAVGDTIVVSGIFKRIDKEGHVLINRVKKG